MVRSPEPSILVAPVKAPAFNVAVPSVNEVPVIAPEALIVVAPDIGPVFVMPPVVLFNDLVTVSPSASTLNPVIVIVPMVRSPEPSILVAPDKAPFNNVAVPSEIDEPVVTLRSPPTNNFLAIATPPSVLIEAVEVAEVASVESLISNSSDN